MPGGIDLHFMDQQGPYYQLKNVFNVLLKKHLAWPEGDYIYSYFK